MKNRKNLCQKSRCDVKKTGKILIAAGLGVFLIVCLPHAVWFVALAVLAAFLGWQLLRC